MTVVHGGGGCDSGSWKWWLCQWFVEVVVVTVVHGGGGYDSGSWRWVFNG